MRSMLYFLYEELSHVCGGVLAILGGVIGCIDAAVPGLITGALLGLLVGEIVGAIAISVLVLLFGTWATSDPILERGEKAVSESAGGRTRRYILRTVLIAVLLVLLHEGYWIANMADLTVNHNTGAYLTQATKRGDSRERLRDDLKERRWQLEIFAARPLKWLLEDEPAALNQANLEFIEVVNGKGIDKPGAGLRDTLQAKAIAALWRSDNVLAQAFTDQTLNAYGWGVIQLTRTEIEKYQSKGWVLRHMPAKWFQQ